MLLDIEPMVAPEGCVSIQADIREAAAVTYAMQGCQAVIHAMEKLDLAFPKVDADKRKELKEARAALERES